MTQAEYLQLLPPTSDRMADMLRCNRGSFSERRRHIESRKRQIRALKLRLGLEGGGSHSGARLPVAVAEFKAAIEQEQE
jgi:hypothetical protein